MSAIHRKYRLSEIAEVLRGISFGSSEGQDRPLENHLPVLRAGNIQDRLLVETDLVWVPKSRVNVNQLIKQHDIIMCTSSGSASLVGKCARAESDWQGSFGAFCAGIRPNKVKCDPSYLHHFLRSSAFTNWSTISSGANIKNIRKSELEEFEIPLPPLDEQRRIATILDKTDAIRRKRQQSIRLTEEFLRSTFLDMFGDPVTNPKGLKTGMLGDYTDMETGYAFKSEYFQDAGIKLCRGANVLPEEIDWSDVKYWSEDDQIAERYVLREGDVVLAMDRPWISSGLKVARVSNSDIPSYLVQRVARLRGIKGLTNEYIYFCIQHPSFTKHCKPKITETTIPHISPLDIRSHRILVPETGSIEQFSKIAVKTLHTELKLLRQVQKSDTLFNSLTHRAFRGEL